MQPSIETFSGGDTKKRGRPRSSALMPDRKAAEKTALSMYCNDEMQQYFVEIKSRQSYMRTYYGNLRRNITYFNKLIGPLVETDLTKRLELQRSTPEIPKSLCGKHFKTFTIDNDWFGEISSIAGYLSTSNSNAGLILSYICLPIGFYVHYPRLISLYEHMEDFLNKYYIIGDLKLHRLQMVKDAHNGVYDNTSDQLKLLQGIIEIYDNISNENFDNEDFKKDVDTIVSLLNTEFLTISQIDYMEHLINRYWALLVNNGYTKNLKYW